MEYSTLPSSALSSIKTYKLSTPQEKLDDLRALIKAGKIAPKTYESTHADTKNDKYGIEYDWLVHARDEWLKLDWRKTEEYINSFPQFVAKIDYGGASWDIHFTAMFSKKKDAVPLLYLHGWPGNMLEFYPTLELLKKKYTPETLPYHVIVPSLPGYALSSGPPVDREPNPNDMSSIMDALMQQVGFGDGYVAQGGDVGSGVARMLAKRFDSCKAIHVNVLFIREKPEGAPDVSELSKIDQQGIQRSQKFSIDGSGYQNMHSTRPSTIGFVLQSSPVALLSWIGEKYICWSDETPSLQHILESITLYWVTDCAARCIWNYRMKPKYEPFNKPLGFSSFPQELSLAPESWAAKVGDLVQYRRHDKGGHFAALELPEVLLKDVEDFIELIWKK